MVVLPLVVQLHPFVTLQPLGIGLQGERVCAESSEAPAAIVIALNTPRRAFFTTSSCETGEEMQRGVI
jgi:hypothetical protein